MKQSFLRSPRDCLVVGAAFVIGFFVGGTARLSGLLFVASLERYNVGREKASIPFIVSFAIRNLSSPITGYLGTKFGPRLTVLVGCFFAATGVGICFFTDDFMVVIISWGGIYGLGFGLGLALVPQILSEHFPNHFDKVTGLYLCGVSIAGVILPILGDFSIKTYGVSGSFLILSSALLHTIPAAMILAIVPTNVQASMKGEVQTALSYRIPERRTDITKDKFGSNSVSDDKTSLQLEIALEKPISSLKKADDYTICNQIPERRITEILDDEFTSTRVACDKGVSHLETPFENHEEIEKYSLFLEELVHEPKMNGIGHIEKVETSLSTFPKGRNEALESFGLFLDPTYILVLLSQGLLSYVTVTIWTVIVDAARDHGVEKHNELHVLEALYVFDFLGRILLGHITDSGYITKTNFLSLCLVCFGVTLSIFTCLEGFIFVMVAVSIYGLLTGFLTVVALSIVKQYVEKKNISMGFAALYSFYGLMSFSQPPLIGYFRENLQSYDGLFYILSVMCFISSILTLLIPSVSLRRDRKNRKTEENLGTLETN